MNLLVKANELDAVEPSKAQQIRETFMPMADMLEEFEDAFNQVMSFEEINEDVIKEAKRLRLAIWRVGVDTEKARKAQKEQYLRAGQAIDGVSKILKWAIQEKVDKLKEIENHYEIQEKKRLEKLQEERVKELSPYVDYAEERVLNQMDEDVWKAFLNTKKKEHEERLAAEKKAEEERIEKERIEKLHDVRRSELLTSWQFLTEEQRNINFGELSEKQFTIILDKAMTAKAKHDKEQEAIRKENERLKKEAEAKAKKEAEAKKKRLSNAIIFLEENGYRKVTDGYAAIRYKHLVTYEQINDFDTDKELEAFKMHLIDIREKKEKEIEAEKERQRREATEKKKQEEYEAKLKAEQEERERIQAELKAREEAEAKAMAEAEEEEKRRQEEEKRAAMAPDKDKLLKAVADISVAWPKCTSKEAIKVRDVIEEKLTAYKTWANKQINNI